MTWQRTNLWTPAEIERLQQFVLDGKIWHDIGPLLGRSPAACKLRYNMTRRRPEPSMPVRTNRFALDRAVSATLDQAHRQQAALPTQTLTAEVFGDPLPGRSALDRRDQRTPGARS